LSICAESVPTNANRKQRREVNLGIVRKLQREAEI
jgi:hypothetical protein